MSERIFEIVLITHNEDGSPHLAPMGLRRRGEFLLLAPFRPSRSLENLRRNRSGSINTTDDVRVFAGCLSGHYDWPLESCQTIQGARLRHALSHQEIEVARIDGEDLQRPEIFCRTVHEANHRPFRGYNRAQAAILELAILVSRVQMLPLEKIRAEIAYLQIAVDKTAGAEELEAWNWLMQRVEAHRARDCA